MSEALISGGDKSRPMRRGLKKIIRSKGVIIFFAIALFLIIAALVYFRFGRSPSKLSKEAQEIEKIYQATLKNAAGDSEVAFTQKLNKIRELSNAKEYNQAKLLLDQLKVDNDTAKYNDAIQSEYLGICRYIPDYACLDKALDNLAKNGEQYVYSEYIGLGYFFNQQNNKALSKTYYKKALDLANKNGGAIFVENYNKSSDVQLKETYDQLKGNAI